MELEKQTDSLLESKVRDGRDSSRTANGRERQYWETQATIERKKVREKRKREREKDVGNKITGKRKERKHKENMSWRGEKP